ncbi:DUF2927 domain-containing protein [Leptolyngbya sp. FACHB-16]|uniref:DUF2927 domain-containing protein n=1 Tax=unclassified Leptolyngbya TaxID=2650499 RepID=UPI001684D265|nr:DUF2927 domain-containing protein [Leptolyngbya sp. FACHB-16]MBD1913717.1 DUF2927 domain-containing protein [Leptolyngbya sp. FACHB-8]
MRFISLVVATYLGVGAFIVASPFGSAQSVRQQATISPRDGSSVVDLRSAPAGAGRVFGQGRSGDSGEIVDEHQGDDGYTWYFIRFPNMTRGAWVRSDTVSLGNAGAASTPPSSGVAVPQASRDPLPNQPGTTAPSGGLSAHLEPSSNQYATTGSIAQPSSQTQPRRRLGFRRPSLTTTPVNPVQPPRNETAPFNQEVVDYFLEIALGNEWGSSNNTIRRWTQNLRIQIVGSPTETDMATLQAVVSELNQLTNGQVSLQFVQDNPNVQLYFVPQSEFSRYEPNYVPQNLGFFWSRWNDRGIYNSRILISTTGVSQTERSHLIREELTQSMGLMRDSYRYDDSIFQQRWTQTTRYSDIDRAIIQLLYRPDIRPGMTRAQVLTQLGL